MSQRASPTAIGAFVLGAVALVVIGLIVFGGGRFFTDKVRYVAYFDESVGGLSAGAPVNFRGVKIGEVADVVVQMDTRDLSVQIPVILEITRRRVVVVGPDIEPGNLSKLIEKGMRAQLQVQSLVTGQLAVQLDFHPEKEARFVGGDSGLPEMPTVPSSMAELAETIESLSLEQLIQDAEEALAGVNRLVNSPEVAEILQGANLAVGELRSLIRNLDGRIGPVTARLEATLADAQDTLSIAAEGSPVRHEMEQVLGELARAARSIRILAEYLERNPDALLRGKTAPGGSR